jgi:hypothetical protein
MRHRPGTARAPDLRNGGWCPERCQGEAEGRTGPGRSQVPAPANLSQEIGGRGFALENRLGFAVRNRYAPDRGGEFFSLKTIPPSCCTTPTDPFVAFPASSTGLQTELV